MASPKVFVLGPARSGTSITYTCLRRVFGLPGRGESHVMPAFQRMLEEFDRYKAIERSDPKILLTDLVQGDVRPHLVAAIRAFYARIFPDGAWVDKTPGAQAIMGIPLIREAFPEARIVLTKRSGVETVASSVKKFGMPLEKACTVWTRCMEAILWAEEHCTDLLVLEQYDLTNDVQDVARRLSAYLGQPDKAEQVARFIGSNERQKTSAHDRAKYLTLADVDWTVTQKQRFEALCGDVMRRMVYPM